MLENSAKIPTVNQLRLSNIEEAAVNDQPFFRKLFQFN